MGWMEAKSAFFVRASMTNSGSVSLIAAATSTRWCVTNIHMSWIDASTSNTFEFKELWGTDSATVVKYKPTATAGWVQIDLPNYGIVASNTLSALNFAVDGASCGTVNILLNGYKLGG